MRSLIVALVLGTSCNYQGIPVPVSGDTKALEGEWEGTYSSAQSGRTGSIMFSLKAGTDSAYGDVLMLPTQVEEVWPPTFPQMREPRGKMSPVLRISFIRCEGGEVTGWLDPYKDPDTGEWVSTTFEGHLQGNEFRGTFSTSYPGGGRVAGTWSVKRKE